LPKLHRNHALKTPPTKGIWREPRLRAVCAIGVILLGIFVYLYEDALARWPFTRWEFVLGELQQVTVTPSPGTLLGPILRAWRRGKGLKPLIQTAGTK
jgi:hypothetical protein